MQLALVTGATGFIGTNLTKFLLKHNFAVIAVDNFCSSGRWKKDLFTDNLNYEFVESDITQDLATAVSETKLFKQYKKFDRVYNLACPASPPRYQALPLETIEVCTHGLRNVLDIAKEHSATVLHTSTSEVYGDPEVHPQPENYRGNVNTLGPRSCYDEGKRIAETICYEYRQNFGVNVKLVRIFNTYGPYMDPNDGRVVTNFVKQALEGQDITVFGNGQQTRSFQYVDDLIAGVEKLMQTEADFMGPVNIGNPDEFTILQLAELVIEKIGGKSKLAHQGLPKDDPKQRKPDIRLAKEKLGWEPQIVLSEGLEKMIEYMREYKDKE